MKHATIALALLTTLYAPAAAPDFHFSLGNDAYQAENYDVAFREWKPLAEIGIAEAQFNIGLMHYHGQGVPQDFVEAVKWYRLAADQEFLAARNYLGKMHFSGQGTPQGYLEAVKWYRLAAEQNNSNAQLNLGIIYEYGLGLPQNNTMAHTWYQMAANNGYKQAFEYMADRATQMTTEDIIKAQSMARECINSGYKKCGY